MKSAARRFGKNKQGKFKEPFSAEGGMKDLEKAARRREWAVRWINCITFVGCHHPARSDDPGYGLDSGSSPE
ncbi:hypothetical protein JXB22_03745 [candidate division WOR-3 bacterium]|nr:hypothetical protein [candidate division WOR-3 bacterium]